MCQQELYYHIQIAQSTEKYLVNQEILEKLLFNLPYWLSKLTNVDGNLSNISSAFARYLLICKSLLVNL